MQRRMLLKRSLFMWMRLGRQRCPGFQFEPGPFWREKRSQWTRTTCMSNASIVSRSSSTTKLSPDLLSLTSSVIGVPLCMSFLNLNLKKRHKEKKPTGVYL